jgi:hypothetical protein
VVKELYYTMNEDFLQIRHEGDDAHLIFQWEGFRVFRSGHEMRLI